MPYEWPVRVFVPVGYTRTPVWWLKTPPQSLAHLARSDIPSKSLPRCHPMPLLLLLRLGYILLQAPVHPVWVQTEHLPGITWNRIVY